MNPIATLLHRWREDPGGSYRLWFLWEERLKNFRSIRRGLAVVDDDIRTDTFGCQYRGSSLETVVKSIAEQQPLFLGADHEFPGRPKCGSGISATIATPSSRGRECPFSPLTGP